MTQLTASIIINNYNYGRFLAEAIESALGQTYPQVEVIVVDGWLDGRIAGGVEPLLARHCHDPEREWRAGLGGAGASFEAEARAFVDRGVDEGARFLALSGPLYRPRERLAAFEREMRASYPVLCDRREVIIFGLGESVAEAAGNTP